MRVQPPPPLLLLDMITSFKPNHICVCVCVFLCVSVCVCVCVCVSVCGQHMYLVQSCFPLCFLLFYPPDKESLHLFISFASPSCPRSGPFRCVVPRRSLQEGLDTFPLSRSLALSLALSVSLSPLPALPPPPLSRQH